VAQIDTGLAGVDEILVPTGQTVTLFRGPNGIVEVERTTGVELASSELVASGIGYLGGGERRHADRARGTCRRQRRLQPGGARRRHARARDRCRQNGSVELDSPPAGPILVIGSGKNLQIWIPIGPLPADDEHGPVQGGLSVFNSKIALIDTVPLPGPGGGDRLAEVANIVYVAGHRRQAEQAGRVAVQPLGNGGTQSAGFATFDTTILPGGRWQWPSTSRTTPRR
jgi:hypothetical protein